MGNRELGNIGERAAAELLQNDGYEILERNYRCQAGEIDIIAVRGSEIAFVEVKTRRNHNYGRPLFSRIGFLRRPTSLSSSKFCMLRAPT